MVAILALVDRMLRGHREYAPIDTYKDQGFAAMCKKREGD
jgi:hypothetical protein